jgi:hypothetical protein
MKLRRLSRKEKGGQKEGGGRWYEETEGREGGEEGRSEEVKKE